MTTAPTTFLACLEWMLSRGYRELMWPLTVIGGTVSSMRNESLADALRAYSGAESARARRYFVAEAESAGGDINAFLYELPADLDPANVQREREEIEKLLNGPQHIRHDRDNAYSAYQAIGHRGVRE